MSTLTKTMPETYETQAPQITSPSRKTLWTGRILTALIVLFMLMDAVMKLIQPASVREATARVGFPTSALTVIGLVLLGSTLLYAIPRTAVLGAILLTGYLGGAVATQVHVGAPVFETLFPVIFGVLTWGGLFLQDSRLRTLLPWRR